MKKILSLLLAVIMVMSLFNGVTVSAAEGENLISGLTASADSSLPTSFAYLATQNTGTLTDGVIKADTDTYKGNYTFNPEADQVVSFAFEKTMSFKEVSVVTCNPTDLPVKGIKSLKVEALIDGDWLALASVDNLEPDLPGHAYAFTSDTAIDADGVRVSMTVNRTGTGYNTISLTEIQVFEEVSGETSLGTMVLNTEKMEKPTVSIKNGASETVKVNGAVTLEAVASVTDGGTLAYQWYKDGTLISGATRSLLTFASAVSSDAGTYKVVATNMGDKNPVSASAEVVLSVDGEATNIALGMPYTWENYEGSIITSNSGYADTNLKEMTDGYISQSVSYGDSGYTAAYANCPITFVIKLSALAEVEAVTAMLMSTNSAGISMPGKVTVSYSTDNKTFTDLGVWENSNSTTAGIYAATVKASTPVTARYIKVSVDGSANPGLHYISEAMVYGTVLDESTEETPADATNIALGRKYTSSMAAGQWYNANTTDTTYRLTNGTYGSLSAYNSTQWAGWLNSGSVTIEMDLGAVAKIYEVNTRNFNTKMHGITSAGGYEVYASNDGITWTEMYVNNAMHDKEWLNFKASKAFDARFIKIVVSQGNSNFIFLDEIEVIGIGGKELPAEPDANTTAVQSLGKAYTLDITDANGNALENTTDTGYSLLTDGNTANLVSFDGAKNVVFALNLGSVKTLNAISMYTKNMPSVKVYLADSVVNGKVNWVYMDTVTKADTYTYAFDKEYKAQFVKLVFTASSGAGIYEIEAIGMGNTANAVSPTDGLLDKLTKLSGNMKYTSSTSASDMADANYKLTDGKTNSYVGYDHLSGITRYVKFDLGDVYEVNAFTAQFNGSYLPSNIQMMVSSDNANWTLVNNISSNITADANGVYYTEYVLGEGVEAQFVMFTFYKASGITALSEVAVYGGSKVSDGVKTGVENYLIPAGNIAKGAFMVDAVSGLEVVDMIAESGFDGIVVDGNVSDIKTFLAALNEKATSVIKVASAVTDLSAYNMLTNANCTSIASADAVYARENGLGVEINTNVSFDEFITAVNSLVNNDAQGAYVHKVVKLNSYAIENYTSAQLAKVFEIAEKLNRGVLKVSGTETPVEAELASFGEDWVSLAPVDGYEYSIDGKEWGKDPTFAGLTNGETYTLYQRVAETADKEGSVYDKILVTAGEGEAKDPDDIIEEEIEGALNFNMYDVLPGEEFVMTFTMPETVVASSVSLTITFDNSVFEILEIPFTDWSDMQPDLNGCNTNANIALSWCDPTYDANTEIAEGTVLLQAKFKAKDDAKLGVSAFRVADFGITGAFNDETFEPENITPDIGTSVRRIKIVDEKETVAGFNVSGSIKAYGDTSENVTVELISGTTVVATVAVTGNTGTYTFENVANGDYTIKVSKTKHAAREYAVTVADADVTQDTVIWLYGDINGDGLVNSTDTLQMNRKVANLNSLFNQAANADYRFKVANITAITGTDALINSTDILQMNRKIANMTSIFDRIA